MTGIETCVSRNRCLGLPSTSSRKKGEPVKTEPADLMIAPASDRLLSPDELSEYLGIPVQTIYQWRHRGLGPRGHRIGRHVRYRWDDVQAWLATRADDAPGEVARGA